MNRSSALLVVTLFAIAGFLLMNAPSVQSDSESSEKLLRHVVLFKFKDGATQEQIQTVEQEFAKLPSKIDEIHDFEWGTNNSPEDHAKGYTHCFLVTFASEEDRDAYLPHPAHKEFVKVLLPILDEVHVIDYWASK